MKPIDAALSYAARSWPVFPTRVKRPLTPHGLLDATTEKDILTEWWTRFPDAEPSIATGEPSGVVALDIDIRDDVNGLDALDALGIATHPETVTAHTPSGGIHCLFTWPGHFVKTVANKLGRGLDIRGDGGSISLPPGPGRRWDEHLGFDKVDIAPMPSWMVLRFPENPIVAAPRQRSVARLSAYSEAALDGAVKAIISAAHGQQQETLNREAFSIGRLAGGGVIAPGLALEALTWAARQIPSHDARRPWRVSELDRLVSRSFSEGLRQPRQVPR